MPLTSTPGFVLRSRLQTGDKISTRLDANGAQVQIVGIADENGNIAGIPLNPLTIEGPQLAVIEAAILLLADAVHTGIIDVSVLGSVLPDGASTSVKQDGIIGLLQLMLLMLQNPVPPIDPTPVDVLSSTVPVGAATEAKQNAVLLALAALANKAERQPVGVETSVLPTNAATETGLAALLAELGQKANVGEVQPVLVTNSVLPTGAATNATLGALLTELIEKTNPDDIQLANVVSSVLPNGAAQENTMQAILTELQEKTEPGVTQNTNVVATVLPNDAARNSTLISVLGEMGKFVAGQGFPRTLITIVDAADPNMIYTGEALSGMATSDPYWSIQRKTIAGTLTVTLRADGGSFTTVWDDRAILNYA